MLTPTQQRRFQLYQEVRSLAQIAESEGVSREAIRQCLEKMPKDSEEYCEYKAIALEEKGGRPRQYDDFKEHRRKYMQQYRAKA